MARTVPTNFILLGIITLTESYLLSMITSQYTPESVFAVFVLTAAGFIGLSMYALHTQTDLVMYMGVVWGMSFVFLAMSIMFIFIRTPFLLMVLSAFGVMFSLIFIAVDTQMIISQRKYQVSHDDYIIGSLILYLDFIELFINLLRIFGDRK